MTFPHEVQHLQDTLVGIKSITWADGLSLGIEKEKTALIQLVDAPSVSDVSRGTTYNPSKGRWPDHQRRSQANESFTEFRGQENNRDLQS